MAFTKTKPAKGQKQKGSDYDDTNRGVLFQNDKDGNEARPDFTGKLKIDPNQFEPDEEGMINVRLAAWTKNSDRVGDYLSIAASEDKKK